MPFAYYDRLSPARQRIYRQSDALPELGLPPGIAAGAAVDAIAGALASERAAAVASTCQFLADLLTAGYHVPVVRVRVLAQRPSDDYGELHGLYEPAEGRRRACITVWMRTAKRRQVVAFRSFLRTLVHELVHHLDYELFLLPETFHTEGFYKRESAISNALLGCMQAPPPPGRPAR